MCPDVSHMHLTMQDFGPMSVVRYNASQHLGPVDAIGLQVLAL